LLFLLHTVAVAAAVATFEYLFAVHGCKTVVTCKIKHLQKCFRAADFPRLCHGRKNVVKCFILHLTTFYLQHLHNICKNVLQMFYAGYMQNKTLKHFFKCFANVLFYM